MMHKRKILSALLLIFIISGCVRSAPGSTEWNPGDLVLPPTSTIIGQISATPSFHLAPTRLPGSSILTPTPDNPHSQPTLRSEPDQYTVEYGDTLGEIARRYSLSLDLLMQANSLIDPNNLSVGQILQIPAQESQATGSSFKIIPDSELVYGPMTITLDLDGFIKNYGGYLANYQQEVNGVNLNGAQIINLISQNYSVNPRLLLAVLEYRSGWVTNLVPRSINVEYPLGFQDNWYIGLYRQLAWAADNLNRGYYLWKANALSNVVLTDGNLIQLSNIINPGTTSVQYLFSKLDNTNGWNFDVSPDGFFSSYVKLFGYPFDSAIEPLVPDNLIQPIMILPFEEGQVWAFTGGPHGGWDAGSAWAALDFAPPGEAQGCVPSSEWVVAVADGTILRAGDGALIQDLDNDGFEQTGWVVLYMHIESNERVSPGTYLKAGERIGHPSCEGGESTGTHVHLARRFNGEWISADGTFPFNLSGWISSGTGIEYDGLLTRNGQVVEAYNGNSPINQIGR
jgi:LasA protease